MSVPDEQDTLDPIHEFQNDKSVPVKHTILGKIVCKVYIESWTLLNNNCGSIRIIDCD